MTRGRRDRVATALRHFGIVDRFGLADLVVAGPLPSEAVVTERLARFPDALPATVTAGTLARYIVAELQSGDAPTTALLVTAADAQVLSGISNGPKAAGRYHNQILRVLSGVFSGRLVEPRKEQRQFNGRKRIDVVFRNADSTGFFADLSRHSIPAPYIPVECKNYNSDPANPEFDQLSGRLGLVGMFGLMVVRQIVDRESLDKHRVDRRSAKKEWIVVLDDHDVLAMLAAHLNSDVTAVDAVLRKRFEPLVFD
jgi:hypothetical protein